MLTVYCPKCDELIDKHSIKFIDIEEDIQGRDLVTFICKFCDEQSKSFVRS